MLEYDLNRYGSSIRLRPLTLFSSSHQLSLLALYLLFFLILSPTTAEANGRATLVSSQEQGPYRIDVSIIPGQAVLFNTHISILIRTLSDEAIITQANVSVSATGPEGAIDLGPTPALNSFTPQFFEMDLPFDMVGNWGVTVDVDSELGQESIQLTLDVREGGNNINWLMMAALVVVIIAVGIFTWDKVKGRGDKTAD